MNKLTQQQIDAMTIPELDDQIEIQIQNKISAMFYQEYEEASVIGSYIKELNNERRKKVIDEILLTL